MSSVVISYDGNDITDDVELSTALFTALVNGNPGTFLIKVRDDTYTFDFVTGKEITLAVNGTLVWGGYLTRASKMYPLPVQDLAVTPTRYWELAGVDWNVLFQKRIIFDSGDPAGKLDFKYAVGTYDDDIIADLFDNYLDISGDGLSRSGVERVDIVTLDIPGITSGKGTLMHGFGSVANAGYTWKQAMDVIARATGAVYYIDPDKVLHYVDVDTADASLQLSDQPVVGGGSTVITYTDDFNRTVGTTWGTGSIGTWTKRSGTASVSSGQASATTVSNQWSHTVPIPSDLLPATRLHTRMEFTWPSSLTTVENFEADFTDHPGFAYDIYAIVSKNGDLNLGWFSNVGFDDQTVGTGFTPTGDSVWVLDIDWDGTTLQAKAWPLLSSEPAYQIVETGLDFAVSDIPTTPVLFLLGVSSPTNHTWKVDNVLLEGTVGDATPTSVGYQNFKLLYNGTNLVNDMLVWGAALGVNHMVFARARSAASIAAHNRWQGGLYSGGLYHQASADLVASSYLNGTPQSKRGGKDDAISLSCRVFTPDFRVGQKVDTTVNIFDYNDVLPIRRMDVRFVNGSDATFDLVLSHDIDQPWSIFEMLFPSIGFGGFTFPKIVGPVIPDPFFPPNPPGFCVFEDFERTETGTFGTNTDSEITWSTLGSGGGDINVNAGYGKLEQDGGALTSGQFGASTPHRPEAWSNDFDMLAAFRIDALPDVGWDGTNWFCGIRDEAHTGAVADQQVAFAQRDPANGNGDSLTFVRGNGDSNVVVSFPWTLNVNYKVRWVRSGADHQITVWQAANPEPSTPSISSTAYEFVADRFVVYQTDPTRHFITDPAADLRIWWDSIDFDYAGKPCSDATPTPPGFPSTGPIFEVPPFTDGSTYQLSNAFVAGSTQVTVQTGGVGDKVLQTTASYTESSTAGQIVFNTPLGATDVVEVSYIGNGPAVDPNANIVSFAGTTAAEFIADLKDLTIDVLEIPDVTYNDWNAYIRVSRQGRPLLVRPEAGANPTWDGSGLGSGCNGPFFFGSNVGASGFPDFPTDYITFDPAGTGGEFRIQNYDIGHSGIVLFGWVDHLTVNGIHILNCSGSGGSFSHCLYSNSDGNVSPYNAGHHATNVVADNWIIEGDAGRTLNGFQTYHNPNVIGVKARNWTVDSLNRWAFLDGDAQDILLDGWNGTNCNETIDSVYSPGTGDTATGTVSNCDGHGSCGPLAVGSGNWNNTGITDGGGNSA